MIHQNSKHNDYATDKKDPQRNQSDVSQVHLHFYFFRFPAIFL